MLENIFAFVAAGTQLAKAISAFRKDVDSFRPGRTDPGSHHAKMEALDKRTNDLEILTQEQDSRLQKIENSLKDALVATEALARQIGTIYWMVLVGCAAGVSALVISVIALVLRR